MAKLSEKFKLGGGESTAPVSVNQSNKLSDRFTLDTVNTNAFRQPATRTEIPTVEQPKKENAFVNFFKTLGNVIRGTNPTAPSNISSGASQAVAQDIALNSNKLPELGPLNDNESIINAYESLPNQNAFKRFVSQESRDIYNRKQELNPLYEQAKDIQTQKRLAELGLTAEDVMAEMWMPNPGVSMEALFKAKGVTDKKELKDLIQNSQNLVQRMSQKTAEETLTNFADEHGVLGTVASFPLKIGSDIVGTIENTANYLTGKPLSNTSGGNWGTQLVQGMRNEVSDEMNPVGKFAYGVGTSIGDMAPIIALGGGAGLAYAGAAAAQGSIPELIDRGLTPNQIIFTAMANGAAEAALEKLPLGNLEKMAQQPIEKSFKSIAKVIGSQMANEGIEESGTDIANTIFDALINGDKAELNQSIQEKGFWPAVWDYVKQVGYDGLAGAVSGGLMGGGAAGVNVARNGFYNPDSKIPEIEQTETEQAEIPTVSEEETATPAPDFAGIYGWSNSANQIIPQDSYARNAEFLNLENQRSDLRRQIEELEQQNRDLRNQLKSESSDKPREQWDVQDEITALIGDKPQAYTPRGNEIRAQIAANDDILKEIKAQEKTANQDVHYRMANERLSQLDNYEAGDITPATRQEYEGFTTKSGSSDYNDYVRDGKAIIAEMSPEEYIKRCAYQIFGDDGYATLESTLNTRTQKKVDGLVEKIRNGVKLDAPYLNFDTRNQEGLHRALAAYELGIDKIPVIVKGTPLDNKALGFDARNLISEINSERADRNLDALMDELDSDDLLLEDEIQTLEAPEKPASKEIQTLEKPKEKVVNEDIGLTDRDRHARNAEGSISLEIPMEGGVPTRTDENGTTSQVATNSLRKFFESRYDKEGLDHLIQNIEDGKYQKQVKSMQKTYENAIDEITKYGPESKFDDIVRTGIETDDDLAVAHNLLAYYNQKGDMERVDILMSKMQTSGTEIGRALHFFKIFGDSALGVQQATAKLSGSIAKQFVNEAEKNPRGKKAKQVEKVKEVTNDIVEKVREVKERKKKSSQLAKALRYNVEQKMKQEIRKGSAPKTFDMILEEVSNTLEDEYASVKFSDDAKRFFATMIQDDVKVEIIADEIDHYMKHGSFYPLEQEKSVPKPTSKKLDSILAQMGNDTVVEKDAVQTFEQIREEVKNSLEREMASIDFTDAETSYLARMIEYGSTNEEITNAIVQKLATGYMTMSAEDIEKITQLYDQADHAKTSKESVELKKQAAAIGAKYLGDASFMDKWNAWRYMAMLGNPKTILRNIFGNSLFGAVTDVKDAVGALIESKMVKEGERTKAILNPKTDKALIDACARDFDEVAYEEATKGGHKYNMQSAIESERQIFKSKLLEKGRNLTNDTLENSDIKALRRKYKKALAGYLKANGYDASILKTESAEATKAREYAIKQAKEATFHEDNALAEVLSKASHNLRERGDAIGKVGEVAIESLAPFKKTPANILKEGIEYSPAGLIKFFNQVRTKADLNACIDTLSKNLTGTTILAIGAWLASKGLLVGKRGDDEDPFNKGSDYALKIGNHTFTIDWMAPAALPLFVGAELYKVFNPNESADEAKNFFETFVSLADPVLEMSMLQGLNNMLNALANSKKNSLGSTVTNIASGYVSQSIPTLAGQVARTIDPYRRTTRTNTSSYTNPAVAIAEKAGLKAVNKIPFLSMANEKYVNAWGEPQQNNGGNILGRALQNFVLPGYWNDTSLSPREEKLAKLEKTYTGNGSLIPSLAENNRPTGGRLTNKEYTKWAQTRGNEMKSAVDAALAYSGKLTEKDLQAYIHDIENFANNIAKQKQFGTQMPTTYKKAYEAYINGGRSYKAVMEYYISKKK